MPRRGYVEHGLEYFSFHVQQGKSEGFDSCDWPSNLKLDSNRQFFRPCDLEIWWMTLENNRAPLLCYFKLCAVLSPETPNLGQIRRFLELCNLEIWPMTLQNNRAPHLVYATSSFVHHFVAIGEFKLKLQSWNSQSGSNSTIFRAVWPWNLADYLEQGKSEGFESCDRPIVRKRPIWVKIGDVLSRVTLKFDGWPWKTIGHLSFAVSSFVQHFIAIGEFKLELLSGNAQFGSNSTIFRAVWPWNLTYDLEKE